MKGFTLLEVLMALAITAGVIVTVIGSVNYHTGLVTEERQLVAWTMLARERLAEIESGALPRTGGGTLAPGYPELNWSSRQEPTEYPGLVKLHVSVGPAKHEQRRVTLVRYLAP